jgi:hypothetical protein
MTQTDLAFVGLFIVIVVIVVTAAGHYSGGKDFSWFGIPRNNVTTGSFHLVLAAVLLFCTVSLLSAAKPPVVV